jgi:hypothetical protein
MRFAQPACKTIRAIGFLYQLRDHQRPLGCVQCEQNPSGRYDVTV